MDAQNLNLTGNIYDSHTRKSLAGVNISVNDSLGTVSNNQGEYSLSLQGSSFRVVYKYIGYEIRTENVIISTDSIINLNIGLSESHTSLGVIVVTASRFEQKLEEVPVSMEVIPASIIQSSNTTNIETVINQTSGVTVVDGQANIRGGSGWSYGAGSRVLMLIDDLPLISADAEDVKWSFVPIETIDQIEVIKGASSTLFGSSALNGVINVRTMLPSDVPRTRLSIFHSFYDEPKRKELVWWNNENPKQGGLQFSHDRKIRNLSVVAGGNLFFDNGYRESDYQQRARANVKLNYEVPGVQGLSLGLSTNAMYADGGLFLLWANADSGGYMSAANMSGEYISRRYTIDPFVNYAPSDKTRHKLRGRYYKTTNLNNTNQASDADLYYGEYQLQHRPISGLVLNLGLISSFKNVISELYGNHQGSNNAFFLQADEKMGRFLISAGIRYELNKLDTFQIDARPVFRSGISFEIVDGTHLRTSFGQGYRYPSVAEKFTKTSAGGLSIYPNPRLEPETGWSSELGLRQGLKVGGWGGYVDVAAFLTQYRNMMEFNFGQFGDPLYDPFFGYGFKAINVGKTEITGFEISANGHGQIGKLNLTFFGGYTYMNPINLDHDSVYLHSSSDTSGYMLKYRYYHSSNADLELGYKNFYTGINLRHLSFMQNIDIIFENPIFETIAPGIKQYREGHQSGSLILDYRIGYRLNKTSTLSVIVKNLLNTEYMIRPGDLGEPRLFTMLYVLSI